MAKITMSIPGAVVSPEIVERLREALRPFTLRSAYSWRDAPDEPVEHSVFTAEDIRRYKTEAEAEIEGGGSVALAEFAVTASDGVEYTWIDDESAPLDYLADALSSHIVLGNVAADLRVEVTSDPYQARVTIDNAVVSVVAYDSPWIGHEITDLAEVVRALISETVDLSRMTPSLRPFKIFIGHGGDRKWEAVREYIVAAGYEVEAFESSPRAGEMTLAVVEKMITESAVAVIVMTAVDRMKDDRMLARQNVVHELGFAQGRIGVANTIVLLEEGAEEPTNIAGLTQIRFSNGEVHTTKEHVLASIVNKQRERESRPGLAIAAARVEDVVRAH